MELLDVCLLDCGELCVCVGCIVGDDVDYEVVFVCDFVG